MAANKFRTIVTGNESLFILEYQHSAKWSLHLEEVPEMASQQVGTKKLMLTVIYGAGSFHVVDLMTSKRSLDSQYFVSNVMTPLITNIFPQWRIPHDRRLHLHVDNCRVHFSKVTEQFMTQNQTLCMPSPHYSPDIAALDFWLFAYVKNSLVGRTFDEPDQLLEQITEL
jgi:hypothetical protein